MQIFFSLTKAAMINPKVIPHIMDFIEYHFRDYFDNENNALNFNINFESVVKQHNGHFVIMDDLGQLLMFIVKSVALCEQLKLTFDLEVYDRILKKLLNELDSITLEDLEVFEIADEKCNLIGAQYLNCLEALVSKNWFELRIEE